MGGFKYESPRTSRAKGLTLSLKPKPKKLVQWWYQFKSKGVEAREPGVLMPNDKKSGGPVLRWGRGRKREEGRWGRERVCVKMRILLLSLPFCSIQALSEWDGGWSFWIMADFLYPFHWFNCQSLLGTPLQTYQEILFLLGVCITLSSVKQTPEWTSTFDKLLFMIQDPDQLFLPLWTISHPHLGI